MSKLTEPIYEVVSADKANRWAAERRSRDKVHDLADGFSFRPSGRDGYIYYRAGERLLELYWEMSGTDEFDILLSLGGIRNWVLPRKEAVEIDEQKEIELRLIRWLQDGKLRARISEEPP